MRHPVVRLLVVCLAVLALAACGTPGPAALALRTVDRTGKVCAGFGLEGATLRGAPDDARVAWVEMAGTGVEKPAIFPAGYTARFTPTLEVLDPGGSVAFREGDPIDGACGELDGALILTE